MFARVVGSLGGHIELGEDPTADDFGDEEAGAGDEQTRGLQSGLAVRKPVKNH